MIGLCLLAAKLLIAHAFHVSVCDVSYNSNDKHMKISVRLFLDDLENAVKVYTDDYTLDILSKNDSAKIHTSIGEYLNRNMIFDINGARHVPNYLGGEVEMDVMWCYLEIKQLEGFSELQLTNTIMNELFDDQENLVTVERDEVPKSIRFTNENRVDVFVWN